MTYEGDNTVMAQQAINFLLKLTKKPKPKTVPVPKVSKSRQDLVDAENIGPFEYIKHMKSHLNKKCSAHDFSFFLDLENIEEALVVNMSAKLSEIYAKKAAFKGKFKILQNFISAQEIVEASLAHTSYTSFYFFKTGVEKSQIKDSNLKKHM